MPKLTPRRVAPVLCLLVLAATAGCFQQPLAAVLIGRWRGEPDTAELREQRAKQRQAKQATGDKPVDPSALIPAENTDPTDLEEFAFQIILDVKAGGGLTMAMAGGDAEPLAGTWRVVSRFGDRAVLEITKPLPQAVAPPDNQEPAGGTAAAAAGDEPPPGPDQRGGEKGGEKSSGEQRRFDLRLLAGGDAFTLREVGADPRFGQLYFRRVGAGKSDPSAAAVE